MHNTAGAVVFIVFVILQPELVLPTLGCKADEMTVTDSLRSVECIPCERCPSGLELHPKCGSKITEEQRKHIECKSCKPGFFSNNWDVHPCKECHHCLKTQPVIKECTNMSDTVCEKECGPGHYYENSSLDCQQCSCCCGDSKDIKIAKCINDDKPVGHHCTSHRPHECCKVSPSPISNGGRGDTQSTLTVGSTVGIVVATIAGFIGMVLFVLWFCHRKQKRQIIKDDVHLNETPAAARKQEPGLHVESEELSVALPSYHEHEQANDNGGVHQQSEESAMNGDAKPNRMSNTGYVDSAPSTPDVHVKEPMETINENTQTTLIQPQQQWVIKRQTSTSSDSDKTELKRKRSSSVSSIVSGISRKLSLRQGSFDEETLVCKEDSNLLPENQTFKLSDLDVTEVEHVGKMLDNPAYGVGSVKVLATIYEMKKLDIKELTNESKRGEKVLEFINAKYPNLTVYEFCRVLHGKSLERNDIVQELCDYLYRIKTRRSSDDNKSYV